MSVNDKMPPENSDDPGLIELLKVDRMELRVFATPRQAALGAARAIADEIAWLVGSSGRAIGIFDAGEPLRELYAGLRGAEGVPWIRVVGLQLSEVLGAGEGSPASHRRFLVENLVGKVPMAEFHGIRGEAANPRAVCANYDHLLSSRPPDFAVLSAQAAPDLPAAEERDRRVSILREVGAISLTLPAILSCGAVFILGAASGLPSIFNNHPAVTLFLDSESAKVLRP